MGKDVADMIFDLRSKVIQGEITPETAKDIASWFMPKDDIPKTRLEGIVAEAIDYFDFIIKLKEDN